MVFGSATRLSRSSSELFVVLLVSVRVYLLLPHLTTLLPGFITLLEACGCSCCQYGLFMAVRVFFAFSSARLCVGHSRRRIGAWVGGVVERKCAGISFMRVLFLPRNPAHDGSN